jgi:hypothetical protein
MSVISRYRCLSAHVASDDKFLFRFAHESGQGMDEIIVADTSPTAYKIGNRYDLSLTAVAEGAPVPSKPVVSPQEVMQIIPGASPEDVVPQSPDGLRAALEGQVEAPGELVVVLDESEDVQTC